MLRRATRSLLWSSAAVLVPAFAGAQGFALNEIGSCAIARGFAVTGGACKDASTLFWNPAGAAQLPGTSALVGISGIMLDGAFTRDTTRKRYETDIAPAWVPNLFMNRAMTMGGQKMALGLGVYVPYGLTSQWGSDFIGRFASKKASLASIYVQPNIAWQITDKWSIGGGPIFVHSTVELEQAIDLSVLPTTTAGVTFANLGIAKGTEAGMLHAEGKDNGFAGTIGIMGKLTDKWTVGVRYLTQAKLEYEGTDVLFTQTPTGLTTATALSASIPAGTSFDAIVAPQFAAGGAFAPGQTIQTEITHPDQAQIGFNYADFRGWNIEFDYQWTGWKKFKELPVTFTNTALSRTLIEDYNNTSAFRIGAERGFTNKATLRLGLAGATQAAPEATVTPLLPEQERGYLMIGGSYPIMDKWTIDGAYGRIVTPGRRGRTDERADRTITAPQLNNGVYTLKANMISFSLKASF
jgi:long-chain fatty acid transport protein